MPEIAQYGPYYLPSNVFTVFSLTLDLSIVCYCDYFVLDFLYTRNEEVSSAVCHACSTEAGCGLMTRARASRSDP